MKRLSFYLIALLGLFLVACASDEGGDDTAADDTATEETATETAPATETEPEPAMETQPVANPTTITFDKEMHDFGDITQDAPVTTTFTISNTGAEPLVISNAKGSCGCTVPEYPTEPIAPGEDGTITVSFDPKGKPGQQNKSVTITANTNPAQSVLQIKANVAQ